MEGGCRKESLGPLSSREGRDEPCPAGIFHLSATRFLVSRLRGLAGRLLRPALTRQDAWVPRPGSSGFPGELGRAPELEAIAVHTYGKARPFRAPTPTISDGSPAPRHSAFTLLLASPPAVAFASGPLRTSHPAPSTPCLSLCTRPAWVEDLTSGV